MLRIKLTRIGKKNQASYRIVVAEKRGKRDGEYVEQVGFYSPLGQKDLRFETALYDKWISQGAQPTETVASLYQRFTKKA
jgi:small subunit ribosomal protein S16